MTGSDLVSDIKCNGRLGGLGQPGPLSQSPSAAHGRSSGLGSLFSQHSAGEERTSPWSKAQLIGPSGGPLQRPRRNLPGVLLGRGDLFDSHSENQLCRKVREFFKPLLHKGDIA